jgi:Outer membrane protein beta-barrel domain
MYLKLVPRPIPTSIPSLFLAFLLVFAGITAHAQVHPQATQGGVPIVVGIGGADFALDWGPGTRMEGITVWADVYPWGMPPKIHGLGVEVEGRDLNFNRPSGIPRMRHDTGLIGPIYSLPHYKNVRPYIKFLAGIGSIDFPPFGTYTHDTFLVTAPAVGMDFRFYKHLWARTDYQYQFWHQVFGPRDLNPNGVSFGVLYDFRPNPAR